MQNTLNITQKFDHVARKFLPLDSYEALPLKLSLRDVIGVNSLDLMSFYIGLEKAFEIKIRGLQPERLHTLADWQTLLIDNLNSDKHNNKNFQTISPIESSSSIQYLDDIELKTLLANGTLPKRILRSMMQCFFSTCAVIAPAICKRFIELVYRTPSSMPVANWEKKLLTQATHGVIKLKNQNVNYYQWGDGQPILMCHGWSGHATQLGKFVEPLLDNGFSVVALDAPGHGRSGGSHSDIHLYSEAIATLLEEKSFYAAIGHCFGATAITSTLSKGQHKIEKLVFISALENLNWLADLYAKTLKIPKRFVEAIFEKVDTMYNMKMFYKNFSCRDTIVEKKINTLLIHDSDDDFIPPRHSHYFSKVTHSTLLETSGLGHRYILIHTPTIEKTVKFLRRP